MGAACLKTMWKLYSPSNFDIILTLFLLSGRRPDITEGLRKLQCRSLLFVGDNSPFHSEALHMTSKLDRRYSALVEVFHEFIPYHTLAWMHGNRFYLLGYVGFFRFNHVGRWWPRSSLMPCWFPWSTFSWDMGCTGHRRSVWVQEAPWVRLASLQSFSHQKAWAWS